MIEIKGYFKEGTQIKSGVGKNGKTWSNCQIIIDVTTNPMYPNFTVIDVFGDQKIDAVQVFKAGDEIKFVVALAGSSYNNKQGQTIYNAKINLISFEVLKKADVKDFVKNYEPSPTYETAMDIPNEGLPF